jgi:predicted  nucleic acid-binding Zn ribbon protein
VLRGFRLGLQAEKNMHTTSQHFVARCEELESQFADSMQSTQSFVEQHVAAALAKVKGQQTNAQKLLRNQVDEKMQVLSRVMQARLDDISRDACECARCRSNVPSCTCQLALLQCMFDTGSYFQAYAW